MQTLGQAIKAARGDASQAAFAARYGVTQQTVSAWERDEDTPRLGVLRQLAQEDVGVREAFHRLVLEGTDDSAGRREMRLAIG